MKWASASSAARDLMTASREAWSGIARGLDGAKPDLVCAFVSPNYNGVDRLHELLAPSIGSALLVGCTAGGVIGGGREIERTAALALAAASLPGVQLAPFHLAARALPDGDGAAWRRAIGVAPDDARAFLLLSDPLSFDAQALADGLDAGWPSAIKVGGLSSGGRPGDGALLLGREPFGGGAVGVALSGALAVDAVVAQGCRPIGRPLFVTRAGGNVVYELNGRPVLAVLRELYESLDARDRALFKSSLFFGVVMDEARTEHRLGDFLIRNLMGRAEGDGLAVATALRDLQVVQFHLRDARTSTEELDALLARYAADPSRPSPSGALVFSCIGRGAGLYGEPDHDSRLFRERLGPSPLAGFFGNGEIGPVGARTFVHGYTSCFALFSPRR